MKFLNFPILISVLILWVGIIISDSVNQHYTSVSLPGLPEYQPNEYRPDFELADLNGKMHSLTEWAGKVVVVNFWASWCSSCVKEIPVFIHLQQYAQQGVQFIGIVVRDESETVKRLLQSSGINYPILITMTEQQAQQLAEQWGNTIQALPFTVVVNRAGNIVSRFARAMNETAVKQAILPWLG
ncbi:MAG: TlpA family protein disulfide reductase [Thioploca sp.]|nr:TlpA family protein disulfide reductase [Thioploca sp.]